MRPSITDTLYTRGASSSSAIDVLCVRARVKQMDVVLCRTGDKERRIRACGRGKFLAGRRCFESWTTERERCGPFGRLVCAASFPVCELVFGDGKISGVFG